MTQQPEQPEPIQMTAEEALAIDPELTEDIPLLGRIIPSLVQYWMIVITIEGKYKLETFNINNPEGIPILAITFRNRGQPFSFNLDLSEHTKEGTTPEAAIASINQALAQQFQIYGIALSTES